MDNERFTLEYAVKHWNLVRWNRSLGENRFSLTGLATLPHAEVLTNDYRHVRRFISYKGVHLYAPRQINNVTIPYFDGTNSRRVLVPSNQGWKVLGENSIFLWEIEVGEDTYLNHMHTTWLFSPSSIALVREIDELKKAAEASHESFYAAEIENLETQVLVASEAERLAAKHGWNK